MSHHQDLSPVSTTLYTSLNTGSMDVSFRGIKASKLNEKENLITSRFLDCALNNLLFIRRKGRRKAEFKAVHNKLKSSVLGA